MQRAAAQPLHQLLFGHVEQQHVRQALAALGQRLVDQLGLGGGSRKPVEDRPLLRLGFGQLGADEVENDVVGDEFAGIVEALRFLAERRAVLHGGADDVPGGDLRDPDAARHNQTLGALARAWRAKKQDEHRRTGLSAAGRGT